MPKVSFLALYARPLVTPLPKIPFVSKGSGKLFFTLSAGFTSVKAPALGSELNLTLISFGSPAINGSSTTFAPVNENGFSNLFQTPEVQVLFRPMRSGSPLPLYGGMPAEMSA